jgi:D-glycero-D-manno-heptose 1,7-bisphosphate phosphatase
MRALLLDRDGVINHDSPEFIRTPADWRALPGSLDAIARAQRAGYRIVVVSNQSGIARGLLDVASLNAIHRRLDAELARVGARIDAYFFCPHHPEAGCACRKPRAGLLEAVAARLGLTLADTPFVGDRLSDAEAALAAGARAMLVASGCTKPDPRALARLGPVPVYADLAAAVDALL